MDTIVTAIQSLCGAGLLLGIALSLYQAAAPRSEAKGFDYATAKDIEAGHRRWARSRR
jgi:hypothetical protein